MTETLFPSDESGGSEITGRIQRALLRAKAADFATGNFLPTEFGALAASCNGVQKLRLLLGNNPDRMDSTQLLGALLRPETVAEALEAERFAESKRIRERGVRLAEGLRRTIGHMRQTDEEQNVIRLLLKWLESNRVEVRAYLRERLPFDLLLTQAASDAEPAGWGLYGNGFLLAPQIQAETTLWTVTDETKLVASLRQRFDALWNEAVPFRDPMRTALGSSWAAQTTTPYLLYLYVLYRLVADRLLETQEAEDTGWLQGFPPLTDFQLVAVQQALSILNQYRGVFVADVVGLGKTYIGTAILKRLAQQGRRATIFCPPSLVPMWEEMNQMYGLAAAVFSTGRLALNNGRELQQPVYQTHDRQVVLIDESHRFRNRDTASYRVLSEYTQNRSCVLLTATPYSLRPRDIYHQIRLFADDDTDLGLDPPRLGDFFSEVDAGEASLIDVLRPLLIRRTRKHIQKHYPDAAIRVNLPDGSEASRKIVFPTREKPNIVRYDVEGVFGEGGVYDYIVAKLGRPGASRHDLPIPGLDFDVTAMTYARYGLFRYVRQEYREQEPYTALKQTSVQVRGFIRILLFKRLESSVEAFRRTVDNLLGVHDNFLMALKQGFVPAGDQAQRLLYDQAWANEEEFAAALSAADSRYSAAAFDLDALKRDVDNDIEVLAELKALLSEITPERDGKLNTLRELLTGELVGRKVLIFTQFEATARYLAENLRDIPQVEWLSGQHRGAGKSFLKTIARFAPKANPHFADPAAEPIRVMVATDVLSEGLNLQDCSTLVNYDLHYNPVRLIQRVGRVDRVGSEADSIYLYNFLPERNVEKILHIEEILKQRIQDIHTFVGEDNAILHPDEQLNEKDMYAAYTEAPDGEIDEATAETVDFTEIEERIRQLQRESPEQFQALRDLPLGARTSRQSPDGTPGTFAYFATNDGYEDLYLLDRNGEIRATRLEEVLSAIECSSDEPTCELPPRHNRTVSQALAKFETGVSRRQTDRRTGPRLSPGQQYAVRHLSLLIRNEGDDDRRQRLVNLERALRSRLPEAALRELNRLRRLALPSDLMRERLEVLYRDLDLGRYVRSEEEVPHRPVARILCSEALIS